LEPLGFKSYTASALDSTEFGRCPEPFKIKRIRTKKAAGRAFLGLMLESENRGTATSENGGQISADSLPKPERVRERV